MTGAVARPDGTTRLNSRSCLFVLLAGIVVTRVLSIYCFYLYDDAYITFRYVQNLVSGQGFVYNIGERVQGITTPLWGLLLSVPAVLGGSLEMWSRVTALLLDLGTATLLFGYLRARGQRAAAVILLFLFAVDLYLAKTAMGGMESSLFLLLTVAAAIALVNQRLLFASVCAALAVFVRPEGLLFAFVLLVIAIRGKFRVRWWHVLAGVMIVALGAYWQHAYYGDWIPQSVRGKLLLPNKYSDVWNLVLFPLRDPLQCLLTVGAVLFVWRAWRGDPLGKIWALWSLLLLAGWLATGAHLWSWYVVPLWFGKALIVAIGMGSLARVQALFSERMLRSMAFGFVAATCLIWVVFAWTFGRDRMETHVYSKLRTWAAGNKFDGQRAYGMDFGAFGYFTGLKIIDEPGLVWPPAITRYGSRMDSLLWNERPEYAFVTATQTNVTAMRTEPLASLYTPLWRVAMDGSTDQAAPISGFVTDWAADFILFRRADLAE